MNFDATRRLADSAASWESEAFIETMEIKPIYTIINADWRPINDVFVCGMRFQIAFMLLQQLTKSFVVDCPEFGRIAV